MDLFGYEKYNLFESDCACVAYQIDSAVAIMNLVSNSTNFVPSDTLTLAQSSEWSSEARGGITRLGSSVGCLWITVTALKYQLALIEVITIAKGDVNGFATIAALLNRPQTSQGSR